MRFTEELQRSLHEATTWHCVVCGFSDGSDVMNIKNVGDLECTLCLFDRVGQPKHEPTCLTILVDFKTKRYKRVIKREDNAK